jgi:hypothetical protein
VWFATVRFGLLVPNLLCIRYLNENRLEILKCVFRVYLQFLSEIYCILSGTERNMIENVCWSSCKVPFILVRFKLNMSFMERFSKNTQISNFMKIRSLAAEFHVDGQTDMKLIVAFRNFAYTPKNDMKVGAIQLPCKYF